jgi:hypothetical protein
MPVRPKTSATADAGSLLRAMGWLLMASMCFVGLLFAAGVISRAWTSPADYALFAILVAVSIIYLAVGSALKRHAPGSRAAGVLLAALALFVLFPVGTILGGLALWHLGKGWREVLQAP